MWREQQIKLQPVILSFAVCGRAVDFKGCITVRKCVPQANGAVFCAAVGDLEIQTH